MTDIPNLQEETPGSKGASVEKPRASHGLFSLKLAAAVFNCLHKELELHQSSVDSDWELNGPGFSLRLQNDFAFKASYAIFARNPHEIVADGYMDGHWSIAEGDLDTVLAYLWKRQDSSSSLLKLVRRLLDARRFMKSQVNSPKRSKENIRVHYDTENPDNVLFEQMLGSTSCYSSAIFDDDHQDLHSAQQNKLRIVCENMNLSEGMRVLDIGSGWGELTSRLFNIGCDTTGITVSHNQLAYCRERYSEQIASGRLKFEFNDYRDFFASSKERFDAVSCIEVLDHIGLAHFNSFFSTVFDNLNEEGTFFLQVITRPQPGQTSSWIDKHIYPGGYIASLGEIEAAYKKAGFKCLGTVDFPGSHYARTLREWRNLLEEFRLSRKDNSLFSENFFRKWELFLASSILAFEHMGFANSHIVLKKCSHG